MSLLFFIDQGILDGPARGDIDDVILSYIFLRSLLRSLPQGPEECQRVPQT